MAAGGVWYVMQTTVENHTSQLASLAPVPEQVRMLQHDGGVLAKTIYDISIVTKEVRDSQIRMEMTQRTLSDDVTILKSRK